MKSWQAGILVLGAVGIGLLAWALFKGKLRIGGQVVYAQAPPPPPPQIITTPPPPSLDIQSSPNYQNLTQYIKQTPQLRDITPSPNLFAPTKHDISYLP